MSRVFFGNFDFEYRLASGKGSTQSVPGPVAEMRSALAAAWIPVAEENDFILSATALSAADFPDLIYQGIALPQFVTQPESLTVGPEFEFVPWGWSPEATALARSRGWRFSAPAFEIVRTANSREFRLHVEQELGIAPVAAGIARTHAELQSAIEDLGDCERGWILKANFGMSGRESVRGRGNRLPEPTARWAAQRIARTGAVIVEPIFTRVAEVGLQIEVPRIGKPQLVGSTELIVDGAGVYRGSRFQSEAGSNSIDDTVVTTALAAAERVQALGYFGPLGIDAMRYSDEVGHARWRPVQDLNARFTFGRLALGFRRLLPAGWCGSWLWLRPRDAAARGLLDGPVSTLLRQAGDGARLVRTSSATAAPGEAFSILVLAASPVVRDEIERAVFGP